MAGFRGLPPIPLGIGEQTVGRALLGPHPLYLGFVEGEAPVIPVGSPGDAGRRWREEEEIIAVLAAWRSRRH